MSEHPSGPEMSAFCAKVLAPEAAAEIAAHMARCAACLEAYSETVRRGRSHRPPGFWSFEAHLTEEQISALAGPVVIPEVRARAAAHLATCARCRADVADLDAYRLRLGHETKLRFRPPAPAARRRVMRAVALAAALLAAALGAAILLAAYHRVFSGVGKARDVAEVKGVPVPGRTIPAETPSIAQPPPSGLGHNEEVAAVVIDGPHRIRIGENGRLEGLDDLDEGIRERVRLALSSRRLETPADAGLLPGRSILRGPDPGTTTFRLIKPRGVIMEARPIFRWRPACGAASYRIVVADSEGRAVAKSRALPGQTTRWAPGGPLRPGVVYSWMVFAEVGGETLTAPTPADPEMKFKLLGAGAAREIERLRGSSSSRLALAVAYAGAGMIDEAELELEALRRQNPQSPLVAKLLRSLRSRRG